MSPVLTSTAEAHFTSTHTHTYTHRHVFLLATTFTHTHTHIHTYTHIHTHIHTHTVKYFSLQQHSHTHTYIHTPSRISPCNNVPCNSMNAHTTLLSAGMHAEQHTCGCPAPCPPLQTLPAATAPSRGRSTCQCKHFCLICAYELLCA